MRSSWLLAGVAIVMLSTVAGAGETWPTGRVRPAALLLDEHGRMLIDGVPVPFGVRTIQAAKRRRESQTTSSSGVSRQLLTVHGDIVCPAGFSPLFIGNVFAFQQKGQIPAQFGGVDPACWKNPPFEADFLGNWQIVGDCVVCEPASQGSGGGGGGQPAGPTTAPIAPAPSAGVSASRTTH